MAAAAAGVAATGRAAAPPLARPAAFPAGAAGGGGAAAAEQLHAVMQRMRGIVASSADGQVAQDVVYDRVGGPRAVAEEAMTRLLYPAPGSRTAAVEVFHDRADGRRYLRLPRDGGMPASVPGKRERLQRLCESERLVYDAIASFDRRGVWLKDLKAQLRKRVQAESIITKAAKRLERDGLVKQVRCVANRRRAVYLLRELEPHESLTGGTWYNDEQEFDGELVRALCKVVLAYVRERQSASLEAIQSHVLLQPALRQRERALPSDKVQEIVDVLVFDGLIVPYGGGEGRQRSYQPAPKLRDRPFSGAAEGLTPCGSCPVFAQCNSAGFGPYNPRDCVYFQRWLGTGGAGGLDW